MQARESLFQPLDSRGHFGLCRLEVKGASSASCPASVSDSASAAAASSFVVAVGIVPFANAAAFFLVVVFCEEEEKVFCLNFSVSKKKGL